MRSSILMTSVAMLALVACGENGNTTEAPKEAPKEETVEGHAGTPDAVKEAEKEINKAMEEGGKAIDGAMDAVDEAKDAVETTVKDVEKAMEGLKQDVGKTGLPALECNSSNTAGNVSLTVTGDKGDSFRISLKCGGTVVASCQADVAADNTPASCTASGTVPNGGARSCPVGPGNGNSNNAKVVTSGCG